MALPMETGAGLFKMAKEKERDQRIWLQWAIQLPYMDPENFMSFDAYKERVLGQTVDMRPTDEILAELDELERDFEHGN